MLNVLKSSARLVQVNNEDMTQLLGLLAFVRELGIYCRVQEQKLTYLQLTREGTLEVCSLEASEQAGREVLL